jgi:hypothetical protein
LTASGRDWLRLMFVVENYVYLWLGQTIQGYCLSEVGIQGKVLLKLFITYSNEYKT